MFKSLAVALLLLPTVGLASTLEDAAATVSVRGHVELEDYLGRGVKLENGSARVKMKNVNPFLHPFAWMKDAQKLSLQTTNGLVEFRIPKLKNSNGQIKNLGETDSGQQADLTSVLKVTDYAKQDSVQTQACTYVLYMSVPVTTCDDKFNCTVSIQQQPQYYNGTQLAKVRVEVWNQQRTSKITTQTGEAIVSGKVENKSRVTTLALLSECS